MTETNQLPKYVSKQIIAERLPLIFPEGTPNRNNCTRDAAASVIFSFIYVGAIEGSGRLLSPKHVYRMTEEQSVLTSDEERNAYNEMAKSKKKDIVIPGIRWYADNSREQLRDDIIVKAFMPLGVVGSRAEIPTTADKPRYYLKKHFVELLDPDLTGDAFEIAIKKWQDQHLNKSALARVALAKFDKASLEEKVLVIFPNKETRHMSAGLSSIVSKAVIEEFTARFLVSPVVLWLSESGNKVVTRDDKIAYSIGLKIDVQKSLPDIILVDLGVEEPLLVFVEVVATDGPVTEQRQEAIWQITDEAGFKRSQVAFVTAYPDRESASAKKTIVNLAWGSFAWFMSEPQSIFVLVEGREHPITLFDFQRFINQ